MLFGMIFDAGFYAETYTDIVATYRIEETALYDYYMTYGKIRGMAAVLMKQL